MAGEDSAKKREFEDNARRWRADTDVCCAAFPELFPNRDEREGIMQEIRNNHADYLNASDLISGAKAMVATRNLLNRLPSVYRQQMLIEMIEMDY